MRPGCCPSWDLCFVRTAWCCGNAHSPKQTALHLNNHLNRTELDDTFWQEPPRLSGIDKGEGGGRAEVGSGSMAERKGGAGTLRGQCARPGPSPPQSFIPCPTRALFLPGQQRAAGTKRKGRGCPALALVTLGCGATPQPCDLEEGTQLPPLTGCRGADGLATHQQGSNP